MEDRKRLNVSDESELRSDYLSRDPFLDSLSVEELEEFFTTLVDTEKIIFGEE